MSTNGSSRWTRSLHKLVLTALASSLGSLQMLAWSGPSSQQRPGRAAQGHGPRNRPLRPRWMPEKNPDRSLEPWQDPTRIVLKLQDGSRGRAVAGRLEASADGKDLVPVQALLESFPGLRVDPYIELGESELEEMRQEGQESLGQELADLSQYFLVRLDPGADTRWLVQNLQRLPEVEEAYWLPQEIAVAGDIVPPVTGDLTAWQTHTSSYNFPWVRSLPGGNAAGISITDVEGSWNLKGMFGDTITHEDLQGLDGQNPSPAAWDTSSWVNPWGDTHHGTAVLGILGADNDSSGVDGLVPGATLRVSAAYTTSGWRIADAIVKAARAMGRGGVILLELQIGGPNSGACGNPQFGSLPLEYLSAEFNAIRQATALGINVIEPAGNGQQDFDDWANGTPCVAPGHSSYTLFDPNLRSSGAIVAGATDQFSQRAWFSNHGRRVDACALGELLATLGYGDLFSGGGDVNQLYTATFGGTSGASPQVTAAAAILQAAQNHYHGAFLYPPHALRLLLRTAGTPTSNPAADRIGEQPELQNQYRILETGPRAAIVFDTQSAQNANLGKWLDGIGDVDGDGYGDVAISEPGYSSTLGRVYVLSGATGEIWWQVDSSWTGQGPRVSAAGDFNKDGYADFIVSDPTNFQPGNIGGFAMVFDGWNRTLLQWTGGALDEQWGFSTDGAGDLDGAGASEILIGAKGWGSGRGRLYVYGSLFASIDGEVAWPGLGHDVANAGDVNRDGTPDIVASATSVNVISGGPGKVYVFSGTDRSLIQAWSDPGNNGFGASVAGPGDANADGYADIVVGLPFYSGIDSQRGRALVYSGQDGSVLHTLDGYDAGGRFGWNVDGLGDVNGNGCADFLVSAYDERAPGPGNEVGAVHVFDGWSGKLLQSYKSENQPGFNSDDYGFAAASAGEIDGDGRKDVIVGAPGWKNSSFQGRVYTYLSPTREHSLRGNPGGVDGTVQGPTVP